ncbi:MAG: ABC transporter substrate-binding protein [Beijerinckiaceae bacterium]|jgi:4,5-dihydroxyphthalate decarboxylase|nr:ABC transporter substrate-binding protein [Beijerinckiaceae bacterium]
MTAGPLLKTAFWDYDRTRPLIDGSVAVEGCRLSVEILRPEETFARALAEPGFDLCELSFSNSVTAISKGEFPYRLIPVFLSRAFRHSTIFVRRDAGIFAPTDLKGRRVGLQEYDMTAAVVVRGFLRDYGVEPRDVDWKVGEAQRTKSLDFPLGHPPEGVSIEILPEGRTLEERLLAGELDAVISLRVPETFRQGDPRILRLFPEPAAAEKAWYSRHGIFPIMHVVGIRADLAGRHPGLARSIYRAFDLAKRKAVSELEIIQAPKVTLPWPHVALDEARSLMGPDPWPYGLAANRHVLERQLQWSMADGLQARPVRLSELFDPDCEEG